MKHMYELYLYYNCLRAHTRTHICIGRVRKGVRWDVLKLYNEIVLK